MGRELYRERRVNRKETKKRIKNRGYIYKKGQEWKKDIYNEKTD